MAFTTAQLHTLADFPVFDQIWAFLVCSLVKWFLHTILATAQVHKYEVNK
jgi:hypothetical protein